MRRLTGWLRTAWLTTGLSLALLGVLELIARLLVAPPLDGLRGTPWAIRRESSPVFQRADWRDDYWREWHQANTAIWWPYVYWRRAPYAGRYIHVDHEGVRVTHNPTPPGKARVHLLFLGGSTLWGMGARDEHTIPSLVGDALRTRGFDAFHIRNLAQDGYVSTQEVLSLRLELRAGRVPDVVVFYDGFNDTYAAQQNGVAGVPQNEANRRQEFNLSKQTGWPALRPVLRGLALAQLARELRKGSAPSAMRAAVDTPAAAHLAANVLAVYFENLALVQALADRYGFAVFFFWQPTSFSKANPSEVERAIRHDWHGAELQRAVESQLRARTSLPAGFVDLQSVFGDDAATYFIDYVHLGEPGNAVVARAIADVLAGSEALLPAH